MSGSIQSVVLATHNPGKTKELLDFFSDLPIVFQNATHFGLSAPEETESTYLENALLKARYTSEKTGLPALADDAGLCVLALNGAPGIYSARYGGVDISASARCEKLLEALRGVHDRRAYFYCVLVLVRSAQDPAPLIGFGKWDGEILTAPRGEHGFGYDPIFLATDQQCAVAELPLEQKKIFSHRGQACRMLYDQMKQGVL